MIYIKNLIKKYRNFLFYSEVPLVVSKKYFSRLFFSNVFLFFFLLLGFFCASLFLYFDILDAPFIWDDRVIILEHPVLTGRASFFSVFKYNVFGERSIFSGFYRPFQIISYWFDTFLFNSNIPSTFRFMSVYYHSLVGLGLFYFFSLKSFSIKISLFCSLLYIVHPLCIESVTYISGRGDVLGALFLLWGIVFWIKGHHTNKLLFIFLATFIYLISLLVKENGVLLCFVFFIYSLQCFFNKKNNYIFFYISVFLLLLGFLFSIFTATRSQVAALSLLSVSPFVTRLLTVPVSLFNYLKLTFFPFNLHMEYHFYESSFFVSLFFFIFLLTLLYFLYRFTRLHRFVFWLVIMISGWLPVNGVYPRLASTIREHWWMIP